MPEAKAGPPEDHQMGGGMSPFFPPRLRVFQGVLAVVAIVIISWGAAWCVGTVFVWGTGLTTFAGIWSVGQMEALRTAGLAIFLFADQAAVVVLTVLAARWFVPLGQLALPIATPRPSVKAILGAVLLFFVLVGSISFAVNAVAPQAFDNDIKPFAELMQARTWWLMLIAAAIGAPLAEELLFRGFLFGVLRETRLGFSGAAAISSVAWAGLHVQYSGFAIAVIVLMGLYLAWLRERTGSLLVSMICHGIYNGAVMLALTFAPDAPLQPG